MVRTRYIGSNRPREAGFAATHKQDFTAHVTGGDWIHLASHISVNEYANLQQELNHIEGTIEIIPDLVANYDGVSTLNAIPIYSDTDGLTLSQPHYPTKLTNWGDIILPNFGDGSYNLISVDDTNSVLPGQELRIIAQGNSSGKGGELVLGCGFSSLTNSYNSNIRLLAEQVIFDSSIENPNIGQEDTNIDATDLFIYAQSSSSPTGRPGNIYLESGLNNLGSAGDIYLYTDPGVINIVSTSMIFDKNMTTSAVYQADATSGNGHTFYVSAQSTSSGIGGYLWLSSGNGSSHAGDIVLNASSTGWINVISPTIAFDASQVSPYILQDPINTTADANDLNIMAQDNSSGLAGNLYLNGGYSAGYGKYGNVNLRGDEITIYSNKLAFDTDLSPYIYQKPADVSFAASLTIQAQSIPYGAYNYAGIPGDLWLNTGQNSNNNTGGSLFLYSNTGPIVAMSSLFEFGMTYTNPWITQTIYTTGAVNNDDAQHLSIAAQNNTQGYGGDLNIYSGAGFVAWGYHYPGDDGNININAGYGQVNINGYPNTNTGACNIQGPIFIGEFSPAYDGTPSGGVFLFVSGGQLYWRDPSGVDHAV